MVPLLHSRQQWYRNKYGHVSACVWATHLFRIPMKFPFPFGTSSKVPVLALVPYPILMRSPDFMAPKMKAIRMGRPSE